MFSTVGYSLDAVNKIITKVLELQESSEASFIIYSITNSTPRGNLSSLLCTLLHEANVSNVLMKQNHFGVVTHHASHSKVVSFELDYLARPITGDVPHSNTRLMASLWARHIYVSMSVYVSAYIMYINEYTVRELFRGWGAQTLPTSEVNSPSLELQCHNRE